MAACVDCQQDLRPGATFCGACGARQPPAAGTATPAEPTASSSSSAPSVSLAIDVEPLRHLAVGARGLVRLRVACDGVDPLDRVAVHARWAGTALPVAEATRVGPGRAAVLTLAITPTGAGFHDLVGVLEVAHAGAVSRFLWDGVHLRVAGDGPQVQVVHIDQSAARVVDNSRSTFAASPEGGALIDAGPDAGDWQAIPLTPESAPAPTPAVTAAPAASLRRVDFALTTERATYQLTTTLAQGDLATVYGGHVRGAEPPVEIALKLADQGADNDLMQHEVRVLGLLTAEAGGPTVHFAVPRDQLRSQDGRLGTVFDRLDGLDLTQVRDRCRARGEPGLAPRHLLWVMRRVLGALGWAHKHGILHGNLDPSHVLIRPRDHMVWLIDWCWAVVEPARTGQGFKAHNPLYSAPEVGSRGRPTPASDLYALGKVLIHLAGGDPATKALPDMDPRLARFIKYLAVESQGGRPQDAWALYLQADKVRSQIWGEHQFVPLEL